MKHGKRLVAALLPILVLWWIVAADSVRFLLPALAVIAAASLAALVLIPPGRCRWKISGLLRFLPFFLCQSLRGGADVAWRALHPRLPLSPAIIDCAVTLPPGPPRIFFACVVSLLPGTLSVRLRDNHLLVHVLDEAAPSAARLRALEERVAACCEPAGE